ncbi:MAG: hypothetical protein HKP12_07645 [Gammaproteobacteria bacterium]|nr:hypothetical protein [Gammaproteobacteria bacterium]NNJ97019.1 hypothetical protein [Gammaproteobacteria bacterium]
MNRYSCLTICLFVLLISCATQQVSYRNDIAPILQKRCVTCHMAPEGRAYKTIGLKLDSYDALMQGTIYGPIIVAGDSRRSILNMFVEGRAAKVQCMAHQYSGPMNEQERELLSDWVNQGALNN